MSLYEWVWSSFLHFRIICRVPKSFNLLGFFDLSFDVQCCLYVANINQNVSDKSGNNWKMVLREKVAE